jgi:3alpha(or 20beta)-hydroxysteroid dehydrogenase
MKTSEGRVAGKIAIVTGGARGMGAAHARLLAAHGAKVVIADILDADGSALAQEIGDAAVFAHLDVTSAQEWTNAVELARSRFGPVNVLINNAGVLAVQGLEGLSEHDYRRVVNVNQVGAFLGMRAVIEPMRQAGEGSIINVSSTAGIVGYTDCFAYVASKWALRGMTKAAAAELAQYRIRVNSIHPGDVDTPMIAGLNDPNGATPPPETIPLGRRGRTEEVAYLALYLASDESGYTTGAEHVVDGGATAV